MSDGRYLLDKSSQILLLESTVGDVLIYTTDPFEDGSVSRIVVRKRAGALRLVTDFERTHNPNELWERFCYYVLEPCTSGRDK